MFDSYGVDGSVEPAVANATNGFMAAVGNTSLIEEQIQEIHNRLSKNLSGKRDRS